MNLDRVEVVDGSADQAIRTIRETLALFAGAPMCLAGSYVFLWTSESFLFDRRDGGYECQSYRSELIVTASCYWRIVRDGVVLLRSHQIANWRRYRNWRSWIAARSRLLERFFEDDVKAVGNAGAFTVSEVTLSDSHELRFRFQGGCELIVTLNGKSHQAWAIDHDCGLSIVCSDGCYEVGHV